MLPSAKKSLEAGGLSPKASSWALVISFLVGGIGIQAFSRVLHHHMPSHVVDCDHGHDKEEAINSKYSSLEQRPRPVRLKTKQSQLPTWRQDTAQPKHSTGEQDEAQSKPCETLDGSSSQVSEDDKRGDILRRPSLQTQLSSKVVRILSSKKSSCEQGTNCRGFTGICSPECLRDVKDRTGSDMPTFDRTGSSATDISDEHSPLLQSSSRHSTASKILNNSYSDEIRNNEHSQEISQDAVTNHDHQTLDSPTSQHHDHHHHVPNNTFLSVGLQTSIAIALHKLPEGFITFATNHANPKLGFAVFLAIFVHNITEGFAMALPLYLALKSRPKAIAWSALLGGASQPVGAGLAALWIYLSGRGVDGDEGEGAYGVLFAVTGMSYSKINVFAMMLKILIYVIVAGIMASVALQLFSESLNLASSKSLCMAFVFMGMGILGISSALTS